MDPLPNQLRRDLSVGRHLPEFASASALVALDLAAAAAALAGSAISITSLQSAFSLSNALTAGTSSNAQAAGAVGDILATIGSQIDTQSAVVGVPITSSRSTADLCQSINSNVAAAGLLSIAVNARSYIGRIGTRLNGTGI